MTGIINWEELERGFRPPMPPPPREPDGGNMWDKEAEHYNRMAAMELTGTLNQIGCIPITAEDTVLDAGCGPGRITCQLAKIAKKVIALDSSEGMMAKCRENIAKNGFTNVETILLDWNEAVPDVNVPKADIIIASRSVGFDDIRKFNSFARKYAALIGWANSPSLPDCSGKLFEGAIKDPFMQGRPPVFPRRNRNFSYNVQYNKIYDAGFEPNVNVVKDGFGKHFASKEEAYDELILLARDVDGVDRDVFKANVDKYLTPKDGGFDLWIETRSSVIWWEVDPVKFF